MVTIIVKSKLLTPRYNTELGIIISYGIWNYVEKKVGEHVAFTVNYVETDDCGNLLATYDEDKVFSKFLKNNNIMESKLNHLTYSTSTKNLSKVAHFSRIDCM